MAKTITGVYDSIAKVRNAEDELVSNGIAADQIYVDKESNRILVTVPDTVAPTITDILQRHDPVEIR